MITIEEFKKGKFNIQNTKENQEYLIKCGLKCYTENTFNEVRHSTIGYSTYRRVITGSNEIRKNTYELIIPNKINISDLKIGMKVMLRSDLRNGERYGNFSWCREMKKDTSVIIESFCSLGFYIVEESDRNCIYTTGMIDYIIEEEYTMEYRIDINDLDEEMTFKNTPENIEMIEERFNGDGFHIYEFNDKDKSIYFKYSQSRADEEPVVLLYSINEDFNYEVIVKELENKNNKKENEEIKMREILKAYEEKNVRLLEEERKAKVRKLKDSSKLQSTLENVNKYINDNLSEFFKTEVKTYTISEEELLRICEMESSIVDRINSVNKKYENIVSEFRKEVEEISIVLNNFHDEDSKRLILLYRKVIDKDFNIKEKKFDK